MSRGTLDGQVAVITGGNSGIGLATARRFTQEGARVALLGRDSTTLDASVAELGDDAIGITGDVQNLEDLDRLFEAVTEAFGSVDILFVNVALANLLSSGIEGAKNPLQHGAVATTP